MVKVRSDLTGKVFGKLTVIEQTDDYISPQGTHYAQWLCECLCPEHNRVVVLGNDLKRGKTTSCGCIQKERAINAIIVANKRYNATILDLEDEYGLYGIGYCHNTGREFYFDMDDYDKIKGYCWSENILQCGYHALEAWDNELKRVIRMHQVLGCKGYDHEDRNPLNNRRYNLRIATATENAQNSSINKNNTSGFIGVGWNKKTAKWVAYIIVNKKHLHLGYFSNKIDAIKARLNAEAKYFKEFAPQRHLFKEYDIVFQVQK